MSLKELKRHRCFKIPRDKLDLFLTSLYMNFTCDLIQNRMDCVFIAEDDRFYDVVVAQYGSYPFVENNLEQFVKDLQ